MRMINKKRKEKGSYKSIMEDDEAKEKKRK